MFNELRVDQQQRWQAGDYVSVDDYLRQYPALASSADQLSDLILSEMVLREARGETPKFEDYLRRYPQCASQLTHRFRSELATIVPSADLTTIDQSAPLARSASVLETVQLDEAGQLLAQETAFQQGVPQIPGYRIVSELGRGGMGVVYRAKQLSANRDVALKVVRNDVLDTLAADTRQTTLNRFQHEAHAAAKLEHENLVPVYDVGDSGSLRYYAMRFIEGTSLYDMIRHKALSNRDAARYIEPVARGLHYAHQQGVLHRDLKPHNIIIEAKTDQPRLTDFGLAKFIEQRNELTHAGEVMGTPSYMSPEQARDSGRVTPLADVYSLGAALYHVLTSRPPFQAANVAETLRQVFDEDPVPPRRLNSAIDRDLETICLKCLQKEPSRRYESAQALADDLKRYLNGEPILARPAGYVERTWRWCRRNPKLAAAIGTAVTLAAITVTSIVVSNIRISAALAQADRNLQNALQVVDDLLTRVSEDDLLKTSGMDPLRRELLAKAQAHYQSFLDENANNPRIRRELANAHFRVGVIEREMGNKEKGLQSLRTAETLQREMLAEQPNNPDVRRSLSETLNVAGEWHKRDSQWDEAIESFTEAATLREKLAQESPRDKELRRLLANVHMNLGIAQQAKGDWQAGVKEQTSAQELRVKLRQDDAKNVEILRDVGQGAFNLGLLYLMAPQAAPDGEEPYVDRAAKSFDQAIDVFQQLLSREPSHPQYLYRLLLSLRTRASLTSEADDLYAKAEPVAAKLDAENPQTPKYRIEHGALLLDYSAFLANSGRRDEALQKLELLDQLLAPLAQEHRDASEHLAQAHRLWADLLAAAEDADQRRVHLQQAIKYFRLLQEQMGDATWGEEITRLDKLLAETR
jgi:serine/threonine protein kinase